MSGKKTKVTLLIPSFHLGGIERVMTTLANGLARTGFSVSILTMKAEGPFKNELDNAIEIVDAHVKSIRYRNAVFPILDYFNHHTPDVFISSAYNEIASLARILSRNKCKLIATVHSNVVNEIKLGERGVSKKIALSLFRLFQYGIQDVVAVSEGLKDELSRCCKIPAKKIHVIYNPVITEKCEEMLKEPVYHPWLVDKTSPVVLSVGRLVPSKGFDTLIKAFRIVRDKIEAKLIVAGDGAEKDRLQGLIGAIGLDKDVQLIGAVDNPFPYMANADLFVLASRSEAFSVVLIEAMFCGTSVVSTNCNYGPSEILEDGRYGELVSVDDEMRLADAMIRNLTIPNHHREALRKRALAFTDTIAVAQYTKLIGMNADDTISL